MEERCIGIIEQNSSEIFFCVSKYNEHYFAKIYDSYTLRKVKDPNNAILFLDKNDLNEIIYILNRSFTSKGTSEWDFIINEEDNKSLHLRKIKTTNKNVKYDLRKYLNSRVYTGWLKTGICISSNHLETILNLLKMIMAELEMLDKGSFKVPRERNDKEYNILEEIFEDFDM